LKLKLGELNIVLESLNKLIDKEIPIKTSYKLSKLTKKIIDEYSIYEENRMKLINKYAEKDVDNNIIINKKDNSTTMIGENKINFNKEFTELINIEMELEFEKIKLDDLGEISISPRNLLYLNFLFDEIN